MRYCDGCWRSPEKCTCPEYPRPVRHSCSICDYSGVRAEMQPVDDTRGFVSHWICKDLAACAKRRALVPADHQRSIR